MAELEQSTSSGDMESTSSEAEVNLNRIDLRDLRIKICRYEARFCISSSCLNINFQIGPRSWYVIARHGYIKLCNATNCSDDDKKYPLPRAPDMGTFEVQSVQITYSHVFADLLPDIQ